MARYCWKRLKTLDLKGLPFSNMGVTCLMKVEMPKLICLELRDLSLTGDVLKVLEKPPTNKLFIFALCGTVGNFSQQIRLWVRFTLAKTMYFTCDESQWTNFYMGAFAKIGCDKQVRQLNF